MAANTIKYAPGAIVWTVNGRRIMGFAPDSFLKFAPSSNGILTMTVGASGTAAVSSSSDQSGVLTASLMEGSSDNAFLSTLARVQQRQGLSGDFDNVKISVYNSIDKSTVSGDGYFSKLPDQAYGKENGTRDWEIVMPYGLKNYAEKSA